MMRKLPFTIALFFIVLPFTACVTTDKYRTYVLDGAPSNYKANLIRGSFGGSSYNIKKVYSTTTNLYETIYRSQYLTLRLFETGTKRNGKVFLLGGDEKEINTEPYNFYTWISTDDADKIIFNTLKFTSKSKEIDLRQKVGINIDGYRHKNRSEENTTFRRFNPYVFNSRDSLNETELMHFRNTGIINVGALREELKDEWKEIHAIKIFYDHIDVVFKKDRYFTLEFDVTLTSDREDYETQNYHFIAKFNRKRYTEWEGLLPQLLVALLLLID